MRRHRIRLEERRATEAEATQKRVEEEERLAEAEVARKRVEQRREGD